MSNKLDKTRYLLYLRGTTVLFKNNTAWCAGHVRGLKNAAEQLKIPLRGSDTQLHWQLSSCVVKVELEK